MEHHIEMSKILIFLITNAATLKRCNGKFEDTLCSKGDVTQHSEVLCKVPCHNLCVLVVSIYELGIESAFWAEAA